MFTVLFVCTANICRTPMAQYYLRKIVMDEDLDDLINVISAGTWAIDGAEAATFSRQVCEENGLDASDHRSSPIELSSMKSADVVLCMSTQHKRDLTQIFPHLSGKISTLREFASETQPVNPTIVDPYGSKLEHYRTTFQEIKAEIDRFWPVIKQEAMQNKAG